MELPISVSCKQLVLASCANMEAPQHAISQRDFEIAKLSQSGNQRSRQRSGLSRHSVDHFCLRECCTNFTMRDLLSSLSLVSLVAAQAQQPLHAPDLSKAEKKPNVQ